MTLLQDQATALSNSVQDLQQQLQDLQLPEHVQQELVPIQDRVRKTTNDLNRSARILRVIPYLLSMHRCCRKCCIY